MTFISYAQNFEDVMLHRALRGVEKGFYIDIGAQDPHNDSVTKAFYDLGWTGINVDPARHWFDRLEQERRHDTNLCVAVSDVAGELRFYDVKDTGLSTTNAGYAKRHADDGFEVTEYLVPCVTLDEICGQNDVTRIHFLKVDCEGSEAAALRGFSFEVRPWIVVVEATEPKSEVPAFEDWQDLLIGHGYHFVYDDGLNRFYVDDKRPELDAAFVHPPNVFDQFRRASEHALLLEQQAARGAAEQALRWQDMSEFLRAENERREAALVDLRQRIELLNVNLAEQRRDHDVAVLDFHQQSEGRVQALMERIDQLREMNESAELNLRKLKEESELGLCAQKEETELRLSRLKEGYELKLRRLHDETDLKESVIADLRKQAKAGHDHSMAVEKRFVEAQATISSHQEQMARERADADRIRHELAYIHQSTSWRVTRPLRATRMAWRAFVAGGKRMILGSVGTIANGGKSVLRKTAQWERLRRPIVMLLGKHSAPVNRMRIFLFGTGGAHLQTDGITQASDGVPALDWQSSRIHREIIDVKNVSSRQKTQG